MNTQNKVGKILKILGLIVGSLVLVFIILVLVVAVYTKVTKQNSNTNATNDSPQINKETNPQQAAFLKACIGDNPAKEAFCSCSYTSLITKFGFEGAMQKFLQYKKTKQMEPEFLGAVAGCVGLMPTKQ